MTKNIGLKIFFVMFWFGIFWACQPEEEEITFNPDIKLHFSADTVRFDTLFTTVGSVTKRLKVYNPSKKAIVIDHISLGRSSNSPYSLYVNGDKGKHFENQLLLGHDSLLVLVEVLIDPKDENLPFLVSDSIEFLTNGNQQNVKLITWGQDAIFLEKTILNCNTTWTADKPIVLLDSVLVDKNCTLTIMSGVKVYANPSSAILIAGTIKAEGSVENPIEFTSSRLDIKDAYGQWGGIILLQESTENEIKFCKIKNATYGVYVGIPDENDFPDVTLSNSTIENCIVGLIGFNSDVRGYNLLIHNCADYLLANLAGGNYEYRHCTFSNSLAGIYLSRKNPAVFISNNYLDQDNSIVEKLSFYLHNSIIWGNLKDEVVFSADPKAEFEVFINHSLVKSTISGLNINNNILNRDPKFVNVLQSDYRLDLTSPGIDAGDNNYRTLTDIKGNERDLAPDLGAYEQQN